MRKTAAILIGLIALVLCLVLLGRLAQTPSPHGESNPTGYTEDVPARPREGPAGLPTPTV